MHTYLNRSGSKNLAWSAMLSDVTYLPSVKFKRPLPRDHGTSPYEMSSISEGKIVEMCASSRGDRTEIAWSSRSP